MEHQQEPASRLARCLFVAGLALALLWPALINGFPLVFYDTGGYLVPVFEHRLHLGRSALYGAFLSLGATLDFWPNVAVQAVLASWTIMLLVRTHDLALRPLGALTGVLAIALLTSLPWFVGQLMPDALFFVAMLGLYLLAFQRERMSFREALGVGGAIAFALASHMAALVLTAAVTLVLTAARLAGYPRVRLGPAFAALAAGLLLALASNFVITGQLALTPGGSTLTFTRLVDDGIVKRFLDETCPDPAFRLCPYREALPSARGAWLWDEDTPLKKLGGWETYEPESRRIILETLRRHPWLHLRYAVQNTLEQFVRAGTGDGLDGWMWHTEWAFKNYTPKAPPAYVAARQHAGQLEAGILNYLHVPIFWMSLLVLFALAVGPSSLAGEKARGLSRFVLLALVVNAAICGVATTDTRAGSRVSPSYPPRSSCSGHGCLCRVGPGQAVNAAGRTRRASPGRS